MKFSWSQYQGKNQTATYATTKDALIQHIQKSYKAGQDVAESLEEMQVINLANLEPCRGISQETDNAMKIVKQTGLDIKYQKRNQ